MNLPNFYDLFYFKIVAKHRNFSRAAGELGITQPTLSTALKRLEESLGLKLLVRGKKGVDLTKEGSSFLLKVSGLLSQWEDIYQETLLKQESLKGQFKLGVHQSIALYALGKLTKDVVDNFPEVEIEFIHNHSQKINEMIINCEIDFGIVVNPIRHPDLTIIKLFEDRVKFWRSKKLNVHNNPESDEFVLITDKALLQTQQLVGKLSKSKMAQVQRFIHSNNLEVVGELVSNGCGVGIVPERIKKKHFDKKLVEVEDFPVFKDEMYFVYRKDFISSKSFNKFKEFLISKLEL